MTSKIKPVASKKRDLVPVSRHLLESVVGGSGEAVVKRPETAILLEHSVVAHDAGESGGKAAHEPAGSHGGPKEPSQGGPLLDPSAGTPPSGDPALTTADEHAIVVKPHGDRAGESPDAPGQNVETATASEPDAPEPPEGDEGEARDHREAEPEQRESAEAAEAAEPEGDIPEAAAESEPVRSIRADRVAAEADGELPVQDAPDSSGPDVRDTAQPVTAADGGDADRHAPAPDGHPIDAPGKVGPLKPVAADLATAGAVPAGLAPLESVAAVAALASGAATDPVESHKPASPIAPLESHGPADNALVLPAAALAGDLVRAAGRSAVPEKTKSARPQVEERTSTTDPDSRLQDAPPRATSDAGGADTLADIAPDIAPVTKSAPYEPLGHAKSLVKDVGELEEVMAEIRKRIESGREFSRITEKKISDKLGGDATSLLDPFKATISLHIKATDALVESEATLKEAEARPNEEKIKLEKYIDKLREDVKDARGHKESTGDILAIAERNLAAKLGAEDRTSPTIVKELAEHSHALSKTLALFEVALLQKLQPPGKTAQTTRTLMEDPWVAEKKAAQILDAVRQSGSPDDVAKASAYLAKVKVPTDHDEKIKWLTDRFNKTEQRIDSISQEVKHIKFERELAFKARMEKEGVLFSKINALNEKITKNKDILFDRSQSFHDARPQRFHEAIQGDQKAFSDALFDWKAAGLQERILETRYGELLKDAQGAMLDNIRARAFLKQGNSDDSVKDFSTLSKIVDDLTAEKDKSAAKFEEEREKLAKIANNRSDLASKEVDLSKRIDEALQTDPILKAKFSEFARRQTEISKEASDLVSMLNKEIKNFDNIKSQVNQNKIELSYWVDRIERDSNFLEKSPDKWFEKLTEAYGRGLDAETIKKHRAPLKEATEKNLRSYVDAIAGAHSSAKSLLSSVGAEIAISKQIADLSHEQAKNRELQSRLQIETDIARFGATDKFALFRGYIETYNVETAKLNEQYAQVGVKEKANTIQKNEFTSELKRLTAESEQIKKLLGTSVEARRMDAESGSSKLIADRISTVSTALKISEEAGRQIQGEFNKITERLESAKGDAMARAMALGMDFSSVAAIWSNPGGVAVNFSEADWSLLQKRIEKLPKSQSSEKLDSLREAWSAVHKARDAAMFDERQQLQAVHSALDAAQVAVAALADAKLEKSAQAKVFDKIAGSVGGPEKPEQKTGYTDERKLKGEPPKPGESSVTKTPWSSAYERAVAKALEEGKPAPDRKSFEDDLKKKARETLADVGDEAFGQTLRAAREIFDARALSLAEEQGRSVTANLGKVSVGGTNSATAGPVTVHSLAAAGVSAEASAYASHLGAGASFVALSKAEAGLAARVEGGDAVRGVGAGAKAYALVEAELRSSAKANALGIAADIVTSAAARGELAGDVSFKVADGISFALSGQGVGSVDATAKAQGKLGLEGGSLKLSAAAEAAVRADVAGKFSLWGSELTTNVQAYAKARAEASVQAEANWLNGAPSLKFSANAMAGAAAGFQQTGSVQFGGVTVTGTAGLFVGDLGVKAGVDIGFKNNVLKIGVDFGAALGVGIDAKIAISIDFPAMLKKAEEFLMKLVENLSGKAEANKFRANLLQLSGHNPFN